MQFYRLAEAKKHLPKRQKTDNKYAGGKSLIVGGSSGMYGAAILAARACSRIGSGFVYILADKNFPVCKNPDFLTIKNLKKLKFSSYAIGPGLKNDKLIKQILSFLYKKKINNVVLDAECLNYLAENPKTKLLSNWILTPHEGELARLLNLSSSGIKKNREKSTILTQKKFGCIVVLKGHNTLVANSEKLICVKSGNPSLAKAGTGDVLTGLIAGLLAQGLGSMDATLLGVFVHGFVADLWVKTKKDGLSLMASDLIEGLPATLAIIRKGKL